MTQTPDTYKDPRAYRLAREIRAELWALPDGVRFRVSNKLDKILTLKTQRTMTNDNAPSGQSAAQIADRYDSRTAIFAALMQGRHLTFMDHKEFKCAQLSTQVCVLRKRIGEGRLPGRIVGEKIEFTPGKYCQRYHWEPATDETKEDA